MISMLAHPPALKSWVWQLHCAKDDSLNKGRMMNDMITIKKVLNNNAITCVNDGQVVILVGKGLAFKAKSGDVVDESKVENVYVPKKKFFDNKMYASLQKIQIEYFYIAEEIINDGQKRLKDKLDDSIYVTITDHIYTAITRYHMHINLINPLCYDIKRLYPVEFEIGVDALKRINEVFNVHVKEDEAAFIALHFVNAEMGSDMHSTYEVTSIMQEIVQMIKIFFDCDFDVNSINYARFLTHCRFFAQSIIGKKSYLEINAISEMYEPFVEKYTKQAQCTETISNYIFNKYGYEVGDDEKLYLTMHIVKLTYRGIENER